MITRLLRAAAGAAGAALFLLGAGTSGPQNMYLRVASNLPAPDVLSLDYDAVATVPQGPGVSPAFLPRDVVRAKIVVSKAAANPYVHAQAGHAYPLWTIVETGTGGRVLRRTIFRNVVVTSTHAQTVRFEAASVTVTQNDMVANSR